MWCLRRLVPRAVLVPVAVGVAATGGVVCEGTGAGVGVGTDAVGRLGMVNTACGTGCCFTACDCNCAAAVGGPGCRLLLLL